MSVTELFDLSGKVVLVTGGNSGIGLAIAHAVADAGAKVCIWGRSAEKNADALAVLRSAGAEASAQVVDIGDESRSSPAWRPSPTCTADSTAASRTRQRPPA